MTMEGKTWGVAIITKNNESTLPMVLESVNESDAIVVVDSGSTDRTKSICENFKVDFLFKKWSGFSYQKQFAIDQLDTDWILSLDSDEVLSEELLMEIQKTINSEDAADGYEIPRLMVFMGKKLAHGKGVDYPIRFFKKGRGTLDGRKIHEKININGRLGRLRGPLFHYSTEGISQRLSKLWRDVVSEREYIDDLAFNPIDPFWIPTKYFMTQALLKQSWRDGVPGIVNVGMYSLQHFLHRSAIFWWKAKKFFKSKP